MHLTLRDFEILEAVHSARYVTAPQIQALFWQESRGGRWGRLKACQRRLRQFTRQGLVRRIEQPVKRGHGPKPFIYALAEQGARVLAEELGVEPEEVDWRKKHADDNYPFLEHLLATNDVRIAFTQACRSTNGVVIASWMDEKELKTEAKDYVTIIGPAGGTRKVAVVPDAFMALRVGERLGHFFLEIDRRTVTVAPSTWEQRGWTRKIMAYLAYYSSGKYQERYQTRSLRILTITTGETRLAHLKRATEQAGGASRFWFTTFGQITPHRILQESIWQVAGKEGLQPLLS